MDTLESTLAQMRRRVSKTPNALESYDAFAALVKNKLITWPQLSADRAAGFIMSEWASHAADAGEIKIPKQDLNWIVSTGKHCRRRLKGAEFVWARELAVHLLRISAKTPSSDAP